MPSVSVVKERGPHLRSALRPRAPIAQRKAVENREWIAEDALRWLRRTRRSRAAKRLAVFRPITMPASKTIAWKQLVKKSSPDARYARPASEQRIASVEQSLGLRLPTALRALLLEGDGITDEYGSHAVWPVAEIERQNKAFRTNASFRELYMPFDHLLLFGADAGSDHFAFAVHADGKIHKDDVYRWHHENDSRSWFASRLDQFLERRLKSEDE